MEKPLHIRIFDSLLFYKLAWLITIILQDIKWILILILKKQKIWNTIQRTVLFCSEVKFCLLTLKARFFFQSVADLNWKNTACSYEVLDKFHVIRTDALSKKCPNTAFFLVRIFCLHSEYGKIQTRKTLHLDTLYAVTGLCISGRLSKYKNLFSSPGTKK